MTRKEEYAIYLKSAAWKKIRAAALAKTPYCVLCSSTSNLHGHHRRYPKTLGKEPTDYVTILCSACHEHFHRGRELESNDYVKQPASKTIKKKVYRNKFKKKVKPQKVYPAYKPKPEVVEEKEKKRIIIRKKNDEWTKI